jgi:hypothetical protein
MKSIHTITPLIVSIFALLLPASAFANTYTYNGAVGDGDWSNTANWTTGIIASTTDTALVTKSVGTSTFAVTVATLIASNGSSTTTIVSLPITVTSGATFQPNTSNASTLIGSSTFQTSATNIGTTTGTTTFISTTNSGVVIGTAIFTGSLASNGSPYTYASQSTATFDPNGHIGVVHGPAIFNDGYNYGVVSGNTLFNNASKNDGLTIGTTTFNGFSTNDTLEPGTVRGVAIFNGTSSNNSLVQGDAYYNTNRYSTSTPEVGGILTLDNGVIGGVVTGTAYGSDAAPITSYVLNGNSQNVGTLKGSAILNGTSLNAGIITATTTFNGSSFPLYGSLLGNAIFNTNYYSSTTPIASGTLTLSGSANWGGEINGTVFGSDLIPITRYVFNDNSYLLRGKIIGNVYLNTSVFQYPSSGTVTISNVSYPWRGDVRGTVSGPDNQPITTYIFTGSGGTTASSTVNGNAIFNGASVFNVGTINGNVTVDYFAPNPIGGNVTGTITYLPQPVTATISQIIAPRSSGGGGGTISASTYTATSSALNPVINAISTSTATTTSVLSTYIFTKPLTLGQFSPDAYALQVFLNSHGIIVSPTGAGSPGNETNKFGLLTRYALKRFQNAHADQILAPAGLKIGTGVFGPFTRTYINVQTM